MKVETVNKDGKVIKSREIKSKTIAPGVKQIDVNDLFNALYGR